MCVNCRQWKTLIKVHFAHYTCCMHIILPFTLFTDRHMCKIVNAHVCLFVTSPLGSTFS